MPASNPPRGERAGSASAASGSPLARRQAADVVQRAFRAALLLWMTGWLIKAPFFLCYLGEWSFEVALEHPLFPTVFLDPWTSWAAYFVPLIAGGLALFRPGVATARLAAAALTACAAVLLVHVNGYNDATFLTAFWSGVWLLWLALHADTQNAGTAERHGPRLALGVIALMFLGGTVGKLTAEYWSGEALYQTYFLQKQSWPYPALRQACSEEGLRLMAKICSRAIVLTEGLLAGLVLFRPAWALGAAMWVMLGIVAASTPWLLSVMGPLLGVARGGRLLLKTSRVEQLATRCRAAVTSQTSEVGPLEMCTSPHL